MTAYKRTMSEEEEDAWVRRGGTPAADRGGILRDGAEPEPLARPIRPRYQPLALRHPRVAPIRCKIPTCLNDAASEGLMCAPHQEIWDRLHGEAK